jgi:putative transposase
VRIFRFVAAKKAEHSIKIMCRVLGVSRSGYHAWAAREPSTRAAADRRLSGRIAEIHEQSRKTYGSPRVHAELRLEDGVLVGRKRVERLMRLAGLSGQIRRRRGRTTIRVQGVRTAPDLVERDFNPATVNRLWCADITYIRTWEGWLYLASVMDCYSRRIVGWAMADHLHANLVVDALEMAVARRHPARGVIHHSDQKRHPELNRSSQHRAIGESTVASETGLEGRGLPRVAVVAEAEPEGEAVAAIATRARPRRGSRVGRGVDVVVDGVQAAAARCSSRTSAGVRHPSVLRGRPLSAAAMAARSSGP